MDDFPNLEALGRGCVSGRISEWPLLKVEARAALDRIARLEAVVRAGDEAAATKFGDAGDPDKDARTYLARLSDAFKNYHAARSRVNRPPLTSQRQPEGVDPFPDRMEVVHDGFGDNFVRCGKDCSAHFARPGEVQCNGDGAKCPNKDDNGTERKETKR